MTLQQLQKPKLRHNYHWTFQEWVYENFELLSKEFAETQHDDFDDFCTTIYWELIDKLIA